MRVGKPASRVLDLKIASLAQASASACKAMGNPASAAARFLVLFGDGLQSAPHQAQRQPPLPRRPPGRER